MPGQRLWLSRTVRVAAVGMVAVVVTLALLAGDGLAAEHTKDSVATIKQKLAQEKAILVDVREVSETNAGHVQGAKLAPLSQLKLDAEKPDFATSIAKTIPRDKVIYMYCRSGRRCLVATDLLRELGYDARALKQGFDDLAAQGFEVAKPKEPSSQPR